MKWYINWLSLTNECGSVIRDWCHWDSSANAICRYCGSTFGFSSQGSHVLKQHLKIQTHKNNRKAVHGKKSPKIAPVFQSNLKAQSPSSSGYFKPQQPVICIQSSLADHTRDSFIKLFHNMFNCDVTKNNDFNLGHNKVSYCFADGPWPFFLKKLCTNVNKYRCWFYRYVWWNN